MIGHGRSQPRAEAARVDAVSAGQASFAVTDAMKRLQVFAGSER